MRTISLGAVPAPMLTTWKPVTGQIKVLPKFWCPLRPRYKILILLLIFAITRNFPFPHTIQTVNDFSSDHLAVMLKFDVGYDRIYDLDIPQAYLVDWDDYAHVLRNIKTPLTEIHSADDVITSIKAFRDTLHNAFKIFDNVAAGGRIFPTWSHQELERQKYFKIGLADDQKPPFKIST